MLPVIALVGRPNVGKSTLFNQLTRTRDALVADMPGVTRDRQYGQGRIGEKPFIVIDTGGIGSEEEGMLGLTKEQVKEALTEADSIIFVLDALEGLTEDDKHIAQELRVLGKPVFLAINKTENLRETEALVEFYALGFQTLSAIASGHGKGILHLVETVLKTVPLAESTILPVDAGIKVAIIGRPNVGKSTLVNRILGENRVITSDQAGTTRSSIYIPFERQDQSYTLIDTAGVRRKGRVFEAIEKFSVIKTLQAIEACHVAIVVMSAQDNVTEQDLRLLGYVLEAGKAVVLVMNKWDGLEAYDRQRVKVEIDRQLNYIDYADLHFISARHGSNVGDLYASIQEAYRSAYCELQSSHLTAILEQALATYQPPMSKGRRIKLRFAHPSGQNPPTITIHGTQTDKLPDSYKRYLMKAFRQALKIRGTPVKLIFKSSENPYAERVNIRPSMKKGR